MDIAQTIPLADTWGMHDGDIGVGWWIVMMGGMVLFWGAIILGIVWLVRGGAAGWPGRRTEAPTEGQQRETPIEVLERRFAEGAISAEEYRERRAVLVGTATEGNGAQKAEPMTAPHAGEGRQ